MMLAIPDAVIGRPGRGGAGEAGIAEASRLGAVLHRLSMYALPNIE